VALSTHSALVVQLERKLKKVLAKELTMTQSDYHDYVGYKEEVGDLIDNYYGMFSPPEERTLAYLKAEVGSRARRLTDYLHDKGRWPD
jgi:hypothetical protein